LQEARAFAPACAQSDSNTNWYRRVGSAFGVERSFFQEPATSEDCLYLNVWTPLERKGPLPVLVWIHGGANTGGWPFEPNYRGEAMAARGSLVFVSIAYRLGVFGFFGHPELRATPAPANFGLLDQISALSWVRDNIGAFGGDPGNVTIAGESAGGANAGYLAASPLATGLFRRVVSQSGGYQMRDDLRLADAERIGQTVASAFPDRPGLAALKRRSTAEILEAAKALSGEDTLGPVADGVVLTATPAASYRRGFPYDLLIGTNEDEWYMYVDADPAKLAKTLDELPPASRPDLAARAAAEGDVRRGHDRATTIANMVCPAYAMAAAAAATGRRVWVYRFTRVRPGDGGKKLLAYHGAEIPYVFDTHDDWLPQEEADDRLTSAMLSYWSHFVRTGDPNGPGLPAWPEFLAPTFPVQELGVRIGPIEAPDRSLCDRLAADLYPGWAP
jgi:para-nitrobenzyl esterase